MLRWHICMQNYENKFAKHYILRVIMHHAQSPKPKGSGNSVLQSFYAWPSFYCLNFSTVILIIISHVCFLVLSNEYAIQRKEVSFGRSEGFLLSTLVCLFTSTDFGSYAEYKLVIRKNILWGRNRKDVRNCIGYHWNHEKKPRSSKFRAVLWLAVKMHQSRPAFVIFKR